MEPKQKHADTTVVILLIFTSLLPFIVQISSVQGLHMYQHHYAVITSSTTGKKTKKSILPISCGKLSSRFSSRSKTLSRFSSPIVDGSFCTNTRKQHWKFLLKHSKIKPNLLHTHTPTPKQNKKRPPPPHTHKKPRLIFLQRQRS